MVFGDEDMVAGLCGFLREIGVTPVLALSGLKAHVILRDYLGLSVAPGWLLGFDLGLALLIVTFGTLALAA